MSIKSLLWGLGITLVLGCPLFISHGQTIQASQWSVPRTEHDYPDLQGNWTNPYLTPLQRPIALGMQRSYTPDQARALVDQALAEDAERQAPVDPNRPPPPAGGIIDNQADGNFEIMPSEFAIINGEIRTAYIVEPADGRLPLFDSFRDIHQQWRSQGKGRFDGPEGLTPLDRCLSPGAQLPLMRVFGGMGNPAGDNPVRNIQIVQNLDYVVLLTEYFSLVRIIRIDSDFLPGQGDKWMGDSIGHYEGDSLIVHTRHFRPEQSLGELKSSRDFEVEESYTRIGENEILFRYTVTDPNVFSQPFTAEMSLRRMASEHKLYEYACHEGNYSVPSMLRAARMEELGLLN